jgi:hypothetical protein
LRWLRHRNQPKDKWLFGLIPLIATTIGTIITGIIGITIITTIDRTFGRRQRMAPRQIVAAGLFVLTPNYGFALWTIAAKD